MFIGGEPHFYYKSSVPTGKKFFDVSSAESLPKVIILYSYQDQDASMIESAIKNGAKGIVIAGSGNGHFPASLDKAVKSAMDQGVPVVVSTRTGNGFVTPKENEIGSGFLNPQKARILLSLALTQTRDVQKIRSYFE